MAHQMSLIVLLLTGMVLFATNGVLLADNAWVDPCTACSTVGNWYKGGCSGLTAYLLGKPYKTTNGYTQGYAVNIGDLTPGDIVGWKKTRSDSYGHVTIYVGNQCCDCLFVDAPLNTRYMSGLSRCKQGGYGRQLYHMIY